MGHTFGPQGLSHCTARADAILNMEELQNKTELQRFNGMINYLGKFIPNFSSLNKPLKDMT